LDYGEILSKIQSDTRYYIENFLWVKTKEQEILPFKLRRAQDYILSAIEKLKKEEKLIRLIILKCRQAGSSSICGGILFHATATKPFTNSLIVSDDTESSSYLLSMSDAFYDYLPEFLQPLKRISNAKELVFENPNARERLKKPGLRSSMKIDTANNLESPGRSFTVHCLHCSEVTRWKKPDETMLGLLQSVPDTPTSIVIIESTARGASGWFYDTYKKAEKEENSYTPLFIPWFWVPEYKMKLLPSFKLSDEELEYRDFIERVWGETLTDEQIYWRRYIIVDKCHGNLDFFKQEYPSTADEAFIFSGANVFNLDIVREMLTRVVKPTRGKLWLKE
jgi:hypothetical protein